jgi:glutamyl-tRNA(Gln) amidotransferase subunit E
MYPETDIPPVIITDEELAFAKSNVPKSWDDTISELQKKYGINAQLAEQIFDSDYLDLFESICAYKKNNPNFVASVLCSTITNLQRQGLDSSLLKAEHILRSFELLAQDKITKESLEIIFENIMSSKIRSPDEFVQKHSGIDENELERLLDELIKKNLEMTQKQGLHSTGLLMGLAMKTLRGKVSGEKISKLLELKITKIIEK